MSGLNKTRIETADFTANPVRGVCRHGCKYCYVKPIRKRFPKTHPKKLTWHPEVLEAIRRRKKPATIFLGSTHDLFGEWVSSTCRWKIVEAVEAAAQHNHLFLTKNPSCYEEFCLLTGIPNLWFGVSIDTRARINEYTHWLAEPLINYISAEPLLEDIADYLPLKQVKGIIVGAQTGARAFWPKKEWVYNIIEKADKHGVKVFLKNSLLEIFNLPKRRELPWKLHTKTTEFNG